jgi:predicted component of type VI protein secretion system
MRHEGWKRYLLVRIGASPLEIAPGETLTIGRAAECSLAIPSQRVSRIHAEIFWDDKQPVLKDLGSENGTLVNGRTIREHRLQDNDEISVGPYSCRYRCLNGQGSVGKILQALDSKVDTQVSEDALRGDLEQVSLVEVLGMLERAEKTGSLEVYDTERASGIVGVDAGRPVHAQANDQTGTEALFAMLDEERGKFRFTEGAPGDDASIEGTSITALLIEHGQRVDDRFTMRMNMADLGDLESEE